MIVKVPVVCTSKGVEIRIDAKDVRWASQYTWFITTGTGYAYRCVRDNGKQKNLRMHRELMGFPEGKDVDHRNGDRLDNRRRNLRVCTRSQNLKNKTRKRRDNKSGVTGVFLHKQTQKWAVQIQLNGKPKHVGLYETLPEAVDARREAEKIHYGEFAPDRAA